MRNIEEYNVKSISNDDAKLIIGGGFFKRFGSAAHRLWNEFCEFSTNEYVVHPGSTFC
jgi:hypothetical protein